MMEFHIKLEFLHKPSKTMKVKTKDGFTALTVALDNLNSAEKDNIKSAGIVYMN